jgi:hypothetical protein
MEPWKLVLPAFIEQLNRKRFGKDCPRRAAISRRTACQKKKMVGRSISRVATHSFQAASEAGQGA